MNYYVPDAVVVHHVGPIWQPGYICAMDYRPRVDDVRDATAAVTRDSVQDWLDAHAGDFSATLDFSVSGGAIDLPFATEAGELAYADAMFGGE